MLVLTSGGFAYNEDWLKEGRGSSIYYKPAVESGGNKRKPRSFWVSAAFKRDCAELYSLLQAVAGRAQSVWRENVNRESWVKAVEADARRPQRQRRSFDNICIVTQAEYERGLTNVINAFYPQSLLEKFARLEKISIGVLAM